MRLVRSADSIQHERRERATSGMSSDELRSSSSGSNIDRSMMIDLNVSPSITHATRCLLYIASPSISIGDYRFEVGDGRSPDAPKLDHSNFPSYPATGFPKRNQRRQIVLALLVHIHSGENPPCCSISGRAGLHRAVTYSIYPVESIEAGRRCEGQCFG